MAKIKDFNTSKPKMANMTWVWAWEVIHQEYDEKTDEYYDNIVARFFDPWKAIAWATKTYGIDAMVQAVLLYKDKCTAEWEVTE